MHDHLISGLLLIVAVIHLLPLSGLASAARVASLYAVDVSENNLEILMRHRAVLFGILSGFFAYAAFTPVLQPAAFVAAGVSIASFFWLCWSVGEYNSAIRKVLIADVIAGVSLLGAAILYAAK